MAIILLVIFIILLIIFIRLRFINLSYTAKQFARQNVIVTGKKGTGKDVLFSAVINKRKEMAYSNINYGKYTIVKPISYLNTLPNTYENLLQGDVQIIEKNIDEETDYYLSDGGIYLPSQYDVALCKNDNYKSLPIFYTLSRHLANMNVHVNVQNINRLWIKLREHADYYITCKYCINLGFWLYLKTIHYESYDDCLNNKLPVRRRQRTDDKGHIEYRRYLIPKRYLTYDTRYFHRVFYGIPAPSKKIKRRKENEKQN